MLTQMLVRLAHPLRIQGNVIEAYLPDTKIGEICEIQKSLVESEVLGLAQVTGFNKEHTFLSLLTDSQGFSRENVLLATGKPLRVEVHQGISGAIIDATGIIRGRLDDVPVTPLTGTKSIMACGAARDFSLRKTITEPLLTGIRAIDGLLTCGQGQRVGIFATAGCGKTSLMNMLIEHSQADIYVIGLIGERGREVTEFVESMRHSPRRSRVILVYATSDRSSVERTNAAQIASSIAEYFSDMGKNVLLFIDSITRYARALRDVALSMGEMPARRGYPASVFEALPKLLERPGCFITGTITAFYTVLIENEEEPDIIGDEVRSILDGHIYLSRKLAAKGHYPAINVLNSLSRVFSQVTNCHQQQMAKSFRDLLQRQSEMQLFIDLGEYRRGENENNDIAIDKSIQMEAFLKQDATEKIAISTCLDELYGCLA
ncbi:Type III secretion system ATPase SpaI/InvC [Erwinia amylovora Ea644]|uniref:type III secretion system ATPase SctN n=1 Tax=Erwinia amylovora TaxID=552 RepID=UPI0002C8EE72|nr:type III secretion system ATPase SctN [Erwinia amylovora]CCP03026.1 Type III secretion system ATPase SpaI/InvC [Erwinia amylovora Ea644]CCP07026.1 Type III secretion system ATPase SpaI/InvC [Erwinia amylovora MR1]